MKEKKLKINEKLLGVGASTTYTSKECSNCTSHFSLHTSNHRGITLIALIITIIVMLILIAVTVIVALNGGLFSKAREGVYKTQNEINTEETLADGRVKVDGIWYDSIDEYIKNNPSENQPKTVYAEANKDDKGFLTENAEYTEDGYTAVIPKGFKISTRQGEDKITTGLVIQDENENEFVWIPVTKDLSDSYSSSSKYSEPNEITNNYSSSKAAYDSQETLDYLYGIGYYSYERDFNYIEEYKEMVKSVNKYDGFYIGRYETTIDDVGNIGSKYNTAILTANKKINGIDKQYRWWGLYAEQKKANLPGNGSNIQSAMIYGVLWDKTMEFIREQKNVGNTKYDVDHSTSSWHPGSSGSVKNSGTANSGDIALNIWDLGSNGFEWTQEVYDSGIRVGRGGYYLYSGSASNRSGDGPIGSSNGFCSRFALYIKK